MKRYIYVYSMATVAVFATVLASCEKDKPVRVTGITLNKNTLTLTVGDTVTLTATVLPENADNRAVTWTSSDTAVAKVNARGLVTAVAKGTATITVTTDDGSKTADCALTVNEKNNQPDPPHLSIEPAGELSFDYYAETKKAAVTANIDWTAGSTADWITVTPTEGSSNDTLNISVSTNTGSGERNAEIIISQVGCEKLSVTLEVKQKANSFVIEQQLRKQDSLALVALYDATNGDGWKNKTGWKTARLEYWYGIYLGNKRVIRIELFDNQLTGSIPAQIGNLSQLQMLTLSINQLTGSIPSEIGNLSQLTVLSLYNNQLSGNISDVISNLSQLQRLNLSGNQLSGGIPAEIGNLSQLQILDLSSNQLTGSIPAQIGNLNQLQRLSLDGNQLSGGIPAEIGNLGQLRSLGLSTNQLTGNIPIEIGNLSQLQILNLGNNLLTGNIPIEIGKLNQLTGLGLQKNQLSGSIPSEIGNLSQMTGLELGNNQLTGSIPSAIGNLSLLQWLGLNDNQLSGNIPPEIGNFGQLIQLLLFNNQLTGSIPPEIGNLSRLQYLLLMRISIKKSDK